VLKEVARLSESEKKPQEKVYEMKGVPISVYLNETGEFLWVLTSDACSDEESVKRTLMVLKKMPADRRTVWVPRLDREETMARCPIIQSKPELSKVFDEFLAAHDGKRLKTSQENDGGENTK
jgi:hypothetical protein